MWKKKKQVFSILLALAIIFIAIMENKQETSAATDIDTYEEYKADYYLNFSPYKYYMSSAFVTPYKPIVQENKNNFFFQSTVWAWQVSTFELSDVVKYSKQRRGYYEAFLFDILYTGCEQENATKKVYTNLKMIQASTVKNFAKLDHSYLSNNVDIISMNDQERAILWSQISSCDEVADICSTIGDIKDIAKFCSTVEDLIYKISKVEAISKLTKEYEDVIRTIGRQSDDEDLKFACEEFANMCSSVVSKDVAISIISMDTALSTGAEFVLDGTWKMLMNTLGNYGIAIQAGQGIGKWAAGMLFSTDKVIETYYEMEALNDFEDALSNTVRSYAWQYGRNKTTENAKKFNAAFEMYMKTIVLGCDVAEKYEKLNNDMDGIQGAVNLFFSYITGNHERYEHYVSNLRNIKANVSSIAEFANDGLYNSYVDYCSDIATKINMQKVDQDITDIAPILVELEDDIIHTSNWIIDDDVTLQEDFETFGNIIVKGGNLDCNGHNLTVYGNLILEEGKIDCNHGNIEIGYNLVCDNTEFGQKSTFIVNGGTVNIGKNMVFGRYTENDVYEKVYAAFYMDQEEDSIHICGDIVTAFVQYSGYGMMCSAGKICLEGDWHNYSTRIDNSGSFKLVLAGDGVQGIYDDFSGTLDTFILPEIMVENYGTRKIYLTGIQSIGVLQSNLKEQDNQTHELIINGEFSIENLNIVSRIQSIDNSDLIVEETKGNLTIDGDIKLDITEKANGDILVGGNLTGGNLRLNGHKLKVTGNYTQREGRAFCTNALCVEGGSVEIAGNAVFAKANKDGYDPIYAELKMQQDADRMTIGGDLITSFNQSSSYGMKCKAGIMHLKGDWHNYATRIENVGTFELVLTGEGDQWVYDHLKSIPDDFELSQLTVQNFTNRKLYLIGSQMIGVLQSDLKDQDDQTHELVIDGDFLIDNLNIVASIQSLNNSDLVIGETKGQLIINGDVQIDINEKANGNVLINGNLIGGNIRLNGNKLKVMGNYTQREGAIFHTAALCPEGGRIDIEGDMIFAKAENDGYSPIYAEIRMQDEKDKIIIGGDFVTNYQQYSEYGMTCKTGVICLKGNWHNYSANIRLNDGLQFDLIADGKQIIYNHYSGSITIPCLNVYNSGIREVEILGEIQVKQRNDIENAWGGLDNGIKIVRQPVDWYGSYGKKAIFTVEATGDDLTYCWQYKKSGNWIAYGVTSYDTPDFKVSMNEKNVKWPIRCLITDADGNSVTTDEVWMKLKSQEPEPSQEGPVITTQPSDWRGLIGKKATFSVVATGNGLNYQWQYKKGTTWTNYDSASATTANFQITMNEKTMKWAFRCMITDADGKTAMTNEVYMKLREEEPEPALEGPVITTQPSNWIGLIGKKATFSVVANGDGLSYQWQYKKGATWANYDNVSAITANFQITMNEKTMKWAFRCVITDANGRIATTDEVFMKQKEDEPEPTPEGPVISGQPSDWHGKIGKKATFSVTATGNGLSYQWQYKKGTTWANYDNESATTANFQISANEKTVKWAFRCVITDADGHVVTTNEVRMCVVA